METLSTKLIQQLYLLVLSVYLYTGICSFSETQKGYCDNYCLPNCLCESCLQRVHTGEEIQQHFSWHIHRYTLKKASKTLNILTIPAYTTEGRLSAGKSHLQKLHSFHHNLGKSWGCQKRSPHVL